MFLSGLTLVSCLLLTRALVVELLLPDLVACSGGVGCYFLDGQAGLMVSFLWILQ